MTAEELRLHVTYDPETGEFRRTGFRRKDRSGAPCGTKMNRGYLVISIRNKTYLCHRLAWLYMTGEWPRLQIDHINLDRADNRFSNLREATPHQNNGNRRASSRNTSGAKGVVWNSANRKWIAQITHGTSNKYLGSFARKEDAANAYADAARKHFGEFARPFL